MFRRSPKLLPGVVLTSVLVFGAALGCSSSPKSASPSSIPAPIVSVTPPTVPATGGEPITIDPSGTGPLGTATIEQLGQDQVGTLSDAYCGALKEFSDKYGPLQTPQITLTNFGDVARLFQIMYDNAPPALKQRLATPLAQARQFADAIKAGTVKDEATAKAWADANLGADGQQKFLAAMVTVLGYSAPQCGIS